MRLIEQHIGNNRTVQRVKAGALQRLRFNFPLKLIALIAAIVLHFFVQTERNPTSQRPIVATIRPERAPTDVEIEMESSPIMVTVTGPRSVVDRLKDGDVLGIADLKDLKSEESKVQQVRLRFTIPTLPKEVVGSVTIDPETRPLRVQVFPPITRSMSVRPNYPKEPQAGFQYGDPDVRPATVNVTGRADRVKRVDHLIVNASPSEAGAKIEGGFPVMARDRDDNPVEGVTLQPSEVHLSVRLIEEPPSKIVPVSATIADLPLPPYAISEIQATPRQVKVSGRPDRLKRISTVETESISVREMTDTQEIVANLIANPDVTIHDVNDRPISKVKIHIVVRKNTAPPSAPEGGGTATEPPADTKKGKTDRPG